MKKNLEALQINKYLLVLFIFCYTFISHVNAQVDHHFFFLNNSLLNSNPTDFTPGTKSLTGADYNERSNSGYPFAAANTFSSNISMSPFCTRARKDVYNFRKSTGLKYTRNSGDNFDNYTITIIIKFNQVVNNTYYRIIDFSHGQSDNGIYAFGNNLNFFPSGNIAANVFSASQFTFLTITRDAVTNVIDVYVNDNLVTTYTDSRNYYNFSSSLIFARDNLPGTPASGEDTNGQIAYINVKNTKSTASQVEATFNNICSLIPPTIIAEDDTAPDANGLTGEVGVLNVLDNDTNDGNPATFSNIIMNVVTPDATGNITLNNDGSVDLAPNTPVGDYTILYEICDINITNVCNQGTITVSVLPIPEVLSTTDDLICYSGTTAITATPSVGDIRWYDAPTGGNLLATGTTFNTPVINTTTTYYAEAFEGSWRVSDTRTPVTVTVESPPLPVADATQYFCDRDNAIVNDIVISGNTIRWYDVATGGIQIKNNDPLVNNTTYYATQIVGSCETNPRVPITVVINETVTPITTPYTLEVCDTNLDGDDTNGITNFDLTQSETTLVNGLNVADYDFYYFEDAARTTAITTPTNFENTNSNNQTIYVRITNASNNSCYTDVSFELIVHPLPVISNIVDLIQCDDDADGLSPFNLSEANELISANYLNETFTYYETQAQAESGLVADQITNFTAYTNTNPLTNVVFARIETTNGCHRTAQINLIVGVSQIPPTFNILQYFECDTKEVDNDNANGIATFDFSDAKTLIENLFPAGGVTATFYNNQADALAELNAISDLANHRNDGYPNQQNIYVRVDSDAVNSCLGLGHYVTLTVDPLPTLQTISDYVLCSDTNQATFDLTTKTSEVIGAQTRPIDVTYHESEQDAINNIAIPNPTNYSSTSKTIYVRAQFDDNNNDTLDPRECVSTDMAFNLVVNPNPVLMQPDVIRICSEQVNTEYDLTVREAQITNNDNSITLSYFETQQDLNNNNPITTPTTYLNTQLDRDIIVLATGANSCTSTIVLSLNTIIYANLNQTPNPIEECETDNNGFDNFDLRRRETDILNGLNAADFEFFYYEIESDANLRNGNAIQSPGNYINTVINTQTIYANVKPIGNDCWQVVPIVLIVNPVPEIAIEDKYVICLDASSQSIPPILSTFLPNPPIDTQLNITEYSFQWYNGSEAEVIADPSNYIIIGATDATYIPQAAGDYTVIATNRTTGCTIPASTIVIGSYPPESITVDLGSDAFTGNNILDITVIGSGEYEYRLDYTEWQDSPRFERVRGGERTIYVRDKYNCNEITEMKVIIDYPKYFTPNGDGVNDIWNIRGIADQTEAKIFVYDRYGKLIKQLIPSQPGWNGTFNGRMMPTDDYWFTVEYTEPRDNTMRIFKAHFTLKR